jgi:hypothetical protein
MASMCMALLWAFIDGVIALCSIIVPCGFLVLTEVDWTNEASFAKPIFLLARGSIASDLEVSESRIIVKSTICLAILL